MSNAIYRSTVKLILEFGRFGVVGVLRTIIAVIIVFVPHNLWGVNYILCNVVGFSVALVTGFILHKTWAFKSRGRWNREVLPYLVIFGIGFLVNMALLLLLGEKLELNKNFCLVIASIAFTITNYLGNKFWTFRTSMK